VAFGFWGVVFGGAYALKSGGSKPEAAKKH
jgi:hypothetical protein